MQNLCNKESPGKLCFLAGFSLFSDSINSSDLLKNIALSLIFTISQEAYNQSPKNQTILLEINGREKLSFRLRFKNLLGSPN